MARAASRQKGHPASPLQPEDRIQFIHLPVGKYIQCDIETGHVREGSQAHRFNRRIGHADRDHKSEWGFRINRRLHKRLRKIVTIDLQEKFTWYLI